MNINTHELAWAAGFFDGEGCTHIRKFTNKGHNTWYLNINVAQSGIPECLNRFKAAVGNLGNINGPYKGYHYKFDCSKFEHVQAIIALLWNYLSGPKKKQIKLKLAELREHNKS
jgi:hypothetical protein